MENNYYMPAEWEEHERTFISWPVKESMVWPENYDEFCMGYADVIRAISEFEPVTVITNENTKDAAKALCKDAAEILSIAHNDAWVRDNGPTFVRGKGKLLAGINWIFNAWGEKYKPYDLDNALAGKLLEFFQIPAVKADIVLEGGSIHSDGEGTILTTQQCLLNSNRNPSLSKDEIELSLKKYLGAEKIIWLPHGLFGDETDGHIDNVACFAKPGTVLFQACYDPDDPNYEVTKKNLDVLKNTKDAKGRDLNLIEIPQPPARFYNEERLTLSYLNFYFANGAIILPIFGEDASETDKIAIQILQKYFPERKVVTVDGMKLIKEGGNVHCITQQMPIRQEREIER
ncbi:MAG: agmatine deiminase family protein [Clostridia bacterium]|nr:agmatine deiminase family protein [Clostridia bacterium]